jgi:hypothetical protein
MSDNSADFTSDLSFGGSRPAHPKEAVSAFDPGEAHGAQYSRKQARRGGE